jgi:hypothetical protein
MVDGGVAPQQAWDDHIDAAPLSADIVKAVEDQINAAREVVGVQLRE